MTPSPIRVSLAMECDDILSYAASQSGRKLVRQVEITSNGPDEASGTAIQLEVSVNAPTSNPPASTFTAHFELPREGERLTFRDIDMPADPRVLGLLDEKIAAEVVLRVSVGGEILAEQRSPLTVLAYNQWMHRPDYHESLAAFVLPGHSELHPIAERAAALLEETTGDGSLQGYQDGKERVRAIAGALYEAIRERGFGYINPPASFEGYGQKIRTPDAIAAEGRATCLETTVLYAAALARAGISPVLFVASGHAFAGFATTDPTEDQRLIPPEERWTKELQGLYLHGDAAISSPNDLVDLVTRGLIQPVETTTLTTGFSMPFNEACDEIVGSYFSRHTSSLLAMVIVDRAWALGVVPIAARTITDGHVRLIEQPLPEHSTKTVQAASTESLALADETTRRSLESFQGPGRVRQWLASLLDLTRRNRLLNLTVGSDRTGTRCLEFDIPLGLLPEVEDRIAGSPKGIEIAPPIRLSAAIRDAGVTDEALREDFRRSHRLYWPPPRALESAIRQVTGQIQQDAQDGAQRLSPAEIERLAQERVAESFQHQLERKLNSLKRSAKEIEDLTGSNSLFLSIGMLNWKDEDSKSWAAPLFLIPVQIVGARGATHRIVIDEGAEITPNYCLREKLKQTYNVDIEELETPQLDDAGIDVRQLVNTVRSRLRDSGIRGAVVEERTVLAILNYSSFRLWRDLRDHWQLFRDTSPVVEHLIERPQQQFDDPAAALPLAEDPLCPVEADDSQREAVRWAVTGRSFVLQGPPGTGKSQTISNILASAMAEGKSVLFVAEKQPALEVVKSRLQAVGLGAFCLDLHSGGDSQAQVREKLRKQLTEAIDAANMVDERRWEDLNARHRAKGVALDHYRDAIHDMNEAGYSVWSARQALRRLGPGPAAQVPRAFVAHADRDWEPIRDALLSASELTRTVDPVADHPWSLIDGVDYDNLDRQALANAIRDWDEAGKAISALPEPWRTLGLAEGPDRFDEFLELAGLAELHLLPGTTEFNYLQHPQWRAIADEAVSRSSDRLSEFAAVLEILTPDIFDQDLDALAERAAAALESNVVIRRRRLKSFAGEVSEFVAADVDPGAVVDAVRAAAQLSPVLADAIAAIREIPGVVHPEDWRPLAEGAYGRYRSYLDDLERLAPAAASAALSPAVDAMAGGQLPNQLVKASVARASDAWMQLGENVDLSKPGLVRWSRGEGLVKTWQHRSHELVEDSQDSRFLSLQRWGRLTAVLAPLRDAGLGDFAEDLLAGRIPLGDGPDAGLRGVLDVALRERLETGEIDRFDGLHHDQTVDQYGDLDNARRQMIRSLIPARLVETRSFRPGERIGEYGELERELTKRRHRLPIRGLISKYGDRLIELTPCFLMSPDSVATYLPPGSVSFDLVVFDEASQIKVAEAVGVLGRGRAAVIVGDTKQMPPSVFGGAVAPSFDDDWDEDETEEFYIAEDMESILDECNESNLSDLTLSRHYRSRHESLIAFSNKAFYESSLITFPAPHRASAAISFRRTDGQYLRRASPQKPPRELLNTNPKEAEVVVDEVLSRLNNPQTSSESICIVTFNAPQMRLVRDLLEQRGGPDMGLLMEERRLTADTNSIEPQLKVRNLETVQGDEADVVLFSVAFSAREEDRHGMSAAAGRVPLNFGPLNRKGGERRLNVAVTRARREMVVFCSFDPEDLAVRDTSPLGIRLVRQFLEVARDGVERSGEAQSHVATSIDYHLADIADALRAQAVRVGERLGLSRFKIDLALGRPGEDDWRVAVLLDGPTWAETKSTYERDILPVRILAGIRNWQAVARVWLPSWIDERERVVRELVELVNTDPPPDPEPAIVEVESAPDPKVQPAIITNLSASNREIRSIDLPAPPPAEGRTTYFEPFPETILGSREILDKLDNHQHRADVVAAMELIIQSEGPVEIQRLCKITARCFNLARLRQSRLDSLMRLVPRQGIRRSRLGSFAWPPNLDPDKWDGYRHAAESDNRSLDEVAPEEIANAMVDFTRRGGSIGLEELIERVKAVFGIARLSAPNRERLESALEWAVSNGRLVAEAGRVRVPAP